MSNTVVIEVLVKTQFLRRPPLTKFRLSTLLEEQSRVEFVCGDLRDLVPHRNDELAARQIARVGLVFVCFLREEDRSNPT